MVKERMVNNMATFAERLRQLKEENGLTIEGMAEKIGCSTSGVREWLYRDSEPTVKSLHKVAAAFQVKQSWLLGDKEEEDGTA